MLKREFVLLAALLVAGCTTNQPSASAPPPASGGGSGQPSMKVVYIPKSAANPYFKQVQVGFEDASKQFKFDFDVQAPATADATSQLSIINDEVQRGVDVIAITPNSPDALNQALDSAKGKGVAVVTVDADLTGSETHRDVAVLPTDFKDVGPSQLELLGKLISYQGSFAILSATTDAPNQNAWIAGIKKALSDPKYSKMKLVDTVYGNDESQKSSTETEGLLTKYPDLKGIIAPTSVGLAAAAQVLDNAGVYPGGPHAQSGGVQLTGLGNPNQMRKAVQKGVVTSFQLWNPADMGFIAGYVGIQVKAKKLDLKVGAPFDVPGKPAPTVADKGVLYAGPLLTFDKSNIDKYQF